MEKPIEDQIEEAMRALIEETAFNGIIIDDMLYQSIKKITLPITIFY